MNLAYGVTAGRDPQTATNDMFAYQDLVDTGDIIGPRPYSTGPGIFPENDFQSLADTEDVVRRYHEFYRTAYLKSYLVGNRKQRQWMVMACKKEWDHAHDRGGLDMKLDLTHAIDGFSGNEHSLPITPLFDDTVQFWSRSGIFYTPTLIVAYGGPWGRKLFLRNDGSPRRSQGAATLCRTISSTTIRAAGVSGRVRTSSLFRAWRRRTQS